VPGHGFTKMKIKQLSMKAFSLIFADHNQVCSLQRFQNVKIEALEIYTGFEVTL
jgi:hypothetical protein